MIESPSNRSMSNTRCLKPGVILKERYKIEEVIGAGGFGITYRAWDPLLQSYVAIQGVLSVRDCDAERRFVEGLCAGWTGAAGIPSGKNSLFKEAQDVARFQSEPIL